ncbi:MAG: phosphorylase [Gammaproteobacteria bacterium]|jgi:ATP adenylyltransferase
MENSFAPGVLWDIVRQRTQDALRCKALQPIETKQIILPDHGVDFLVRQVSSLTCKVRLAQHITSRAESAMNPFLPCDPALFVCDVSDSHICLLNKFNVIENHVLIVTREFEHQENLLTEADFVAWLRCMNEFNSLGFYNGGVIAGASQTHKHMQLIPLPLGEGEYEFPVSALMQDLLKDARAKCNHEADKINFMSCGFPFQHAVIALLPDKLRNETSAASYLCKCYSTLLTAVGIKDISGRQSAPYNLLVTRNWMWLVPRTREFFEFISVNALGFAGSLFVHNAKEFELLRQVGPMEVLRFVSES